MGRLAAVFAAAGWLALVWVAAEADDKGGLPADLAYVPGKAAIVVTLRLGQLWEHEFAKGLRGKLGKEADELATSIKKNLGLPVTEVERVTMVMTHVAPGAGGNQLTFVAAAKSVDRAKLLAALVPGGEEKTHAGQKYFANEKHALVILDDRHFVQGHSGDVQSMLDAGKVKADAVLMPALRLAAGKSAVVLAMNPEALEALGDELGAQAEPFKPLLKAKIGVLTLDTGASLKAALRVEFAGVDDAKDGAKAVEASRNLAIMALGQAMKQFGKMPEAAAGVKLLGLLNKELQSAKVTRDGTAVSAGVEMKTDQKMLGPFLGEAAASIRVVSARTRGANNLKQIGLALHNYEGVNGALPPQAVYDKDGKALLSWRVLILPYIEQDALYREFKLNEPWDSPHNKKLLARMPQTFQLPLAKPKHEFGTFYQVFHGKGTAFEGKTGHKLTSIADGTSNTLFAVEAASDVPWTKPEDVSFYAGKDVPKLGGHFQSGVMAMFGDGSVRFISTKVKPETLKALITRAGGEVINDENF